MVVPIEVASNGSKKLADNPTAKQFLIHTLSNFPGSTSIGTTIQQAFIAMHKIRGDGSISPPDRKLINDITDGIMHNTRDLVALHYINDNRSTPFWRMCADLPRPDSLMSLL